MPPTVRSRVGLCVGPNDPYWVLVREAMYQRAEQLSLTLIPVSGPEAEALTEQAQANLLDELLAQDLDALIINTIYEDRIRRILDSGLPVISASESSIRHPRFVSPVGLGDAAQIIARYLAGRLSGQGNVLIAGGLMSAGDNGQSRINSARDVLREFPHIVQLHIPSPWEYNEALPYFEAGLRSSAKSWDAVFGISDSLALAARDAGRALGAVHPNTLVAGINGDPLALAAIVEGSMAATVETSAANHAVQLVDLAHQAAEGQALPSHFGYQLLLVTAENVADVMKRELVDVANLPSRLIGVNRQEEQKRLAQLETSLEINRRIGSVLNRQQLSHEIANLIRAQYGYDLVYLYLWSETEQALSLDQPDSAQPSIPLDQAGLLGQALIRKEPVFIPDVERSRQFPPDPAHPSTRSRVALPIRLGDVTLGLLDLHSHHPTHHTRQDLVGLQLLTDQLGIAMRNAELYDQALQARAVAEKADQLKTRLLANVSHELRAPLNVIMGYSQAALAWPNPYNTELPPELSRDLGRIYASGEHLMRLINDLLDLSRAEIDELNLVPETIAPYAFLEEVFHSIADSAPSAKHVAWLMNLPERLPLIQADPVRLRQILLNLLANARKSTTAGHILLGAEVEPPHLHIWVEDTGSGIPVEQQERIFEPFVTVERLEPRSGVGAKRNGVGAKRNEGIGLGLTVTRRLVELHRGFMTLESQVGRGSTFHVYLPLPNLSGQPVAHAGTNAPPLAAQPVLLMLSARAGRAAELGLQVPRGWQTVHVRPGENLDQLLAKARPMALAWDMALASPGEWRLVELIRNHPQLCQLPFILFDPGCGDTRAPGVTSVMTKPLGSKTLADMIEALRPAEASGPILIVDDDPQARSLYQSIIAQALPGYPTRMAENGTAALAALAKQVPALVILDLRMPEIDGFAVLERMRADERTCHVPVLVISGQMLSAENIKRLDFAQVVFQSKDILSQDETAAGLRRALHGDDLLPQPTSTLVKQTIVYIQHNYAQHLARQQIAQAVGVSEDYLGRIFQQELGLSPIEYLNRYRIKEAKSLLSHTNASITDIADKVGFDDPAYFSRAFRKHVGLSPRAFREQPKV